MTTLRSILGAVAVTALGACASTGDSEWRVAEASDDQPVAEVQGEEEPKLICERIRVTGTKFRKKICGTPEQWARSEVQGREAAWAFHKSIKSQTAFTSPNNGQTPGGT